jgi:thioredoxin-dependent peroxiredoxin
MFEVIISMRSIAWMLGGLVIGAFAVFLIAGQARALDVGDAAPDFTSDSALAGKTVKFSLKDELAKNAIVLYFFPKAFTTG